MTPIVVQGNASCLPLPDSSVDLIVTSPPYFGLRSYTDGGEHYAGQVGDEDTPTDYLDRLIACTTEWMRVLKPSGSIFVNLGDRYSDKSLGALPWRYALRCVDDLGLILRAEIVWSKLNGLPESVTDRVRRSHEQVFHFTKLPRYYSAVDEVREEHAGEFLSTGVRNPRYKYGGVMPNEQAGNVSTSTPDRWSVASGRNALGKLPGSVWQIPTAPLKVPDHLGVDHFAAYPPELVRRIILGWSPREVCTVCGEGRRPVKQTEPMQWRESPTLAGRSAPGTSRITMSGTMLAPASHVITGYACACPDTTAPAAPGVVLDPFGGTGTSALVASCYGRTGISVDLSHDYGRVARWRTTDGGERARVLGVQKPAQQIEGQQDLFGGAA